MSDKLPFAADINRPDHIQSDYNFAPIKADVIDPGIPFSIVRPKDMLILDIYFENFALTGSSPQKLVISDPGKRCAIKIKFPPQHIGEEAFFKSSGKLNFRIWAWGIKNVLDSAGQNEVDLGDFPKMVADQLGIYLPQKCRVSKINSNRWELSKLDPNNPNPTYIPLCIITGESDSWFNISPTEEAPHTPAKALLSGPSYLVFLANSYLEKNPDHSIVFTLESLLKAIQEMDLSIPPQGVQHPWLTSQYVSFIEAPFHLLISPVENSCWDHASIPVASPSDRTELWHTRLSAKDENGIVRDNLAKIRACWSTDAINKDYLSGSNFEANSGPAHQEKPFRMSLDAADRFNLVQLSSNTNLAPITKPIDANRLMLSALGAWLDLRGSWDVRMLSRMGRGQALSVSEWCHHATMGRDHYCRIVYEGFLFPFGHRAALVKVTARELEKDGSGKAAYLRQRMFIVIREPQKNYPDNDILPFPYYQTKVGDLTVKHPTNQSDEKIIVRNFFPFKSIRIQNLVTPDLDLPANSDLSDDGQSLFWPMVEGQDYNFHILAIDLGGHEIEFDVPLLFVGQETNRSAVLGPYIDKFNLSADGSSSDKANRWRTRRTCDFVGQMLTYATPLEGKGGTSYETHKIRFGALMPPAFTMPIDDRPKMDLLAYMGKPVFFPALLSADVFIPELEHFTGNTENTTIGYHLPYLQDKSGPGQVYAEIIYVDWQGANDLYQSSEIILWFPSSRSGGLFTPNMEIKGLSREIGPAAGDLSALDSGKFSPSIFEGMAARLLGQFDLKSLLSESDLDGFPKMITQSGDNLVHTISWNNIPLRSTDSIFKTINDPNDPRNPALNTNLDLLIEAKIPRGSQDSSQTTMKATISSFILDFKLISLNFKSLSFVKNTGRKPDVIADVDVVFASPLDYLQELSRYIPGNGFSDPPYLEVTGSGISCGYSLSLPTIAIGIFSLQNISFAAGLELPFHDISAIVRFNFAQRHSPFTLSVGIFGGGGFLALEMTTKQLVVLELSLEFGATVSVNFGVASGGIYVMGGIYIKYLSTAPTNLYGYLRMGGEVDVLGLISASIELYMTLGYENGKAVGRASITVEVDILFFSTSVEISCERKFAGSSGDPTFEDVMAPYQIYAPNGQLILEDQKHRLLFLDPIKAGYAFFFDSISGEPSDKSVFIALTRLVLKPYRPVSIIIKPIKNANLVEPWKEYCLAFVGW